MGLKESIVDALGKTSLGRMGFGRVCFPTGGFGTAGGVPGVTSPGADELEVPLPAFEASAATAGRVRFRDGSFGGSSWVWATGRKASGTGLVCDVGLEEGAEFICEASRRAGEGSSTKIWG